MATMDIQVIREVMNPSGVAVPLIERESLRRYLAACQKTVPVRVIQATVGLGFVQKYVQVVTLEGNELIDRDDVWVTLGIMNEVWLQTDEALNQGYTYAGMVPNMPGWLEFVPRPEDVRLAVLVDQFPNGFAIHALWGESKLHRDGTFPGSGEDRFILYSSTPASFVATREDKPLDWWLVKPVIFQNSYSWLG